MKTIKCTHKLSITKEAFFAGEPFKVDKMYSTFFLRFKGTPEKGYIQSGWLNRSTDTFCWESHYCNVLISESTIIAYHSIFLATTEIKLKFKKDGKKLIDKPEPTV